MLWYIWFLLLLSLPSVSVANCDKLVDIIKISHLSVIDKDYPYWYSVGQAKAESNCKWIVSKDGHGSVGYFQLTPKFLDQIIRPVFPKYTELHPHHFYGAAYFMKTLHKNNPSKKLWVTFQMFNGGYLVIRECKRADSWNWEDCKSECRRRNVCVLMKGGECVQYRSACDINYKYSKNIYSYGSSYRVGEDKFIFW